MRDLFKQLILDWNQSQWPCPWSRHLDWPEVLPPIRKVVCLIGVRRCGKTWAMMDRMQQLLAGGVCREALLYMNFSDDRLAHCRLEHLTELLEAYHACYPELIDKKIYFFLDEIHEVDGWELFIRRLLDQTAIQVVVTGSSAKMLSYEIATSLRGRALVREVFPFSFAETCGLKGIDTQTLPASKTQALVRNAFDAYVRWGGFPEILQMDEVLRRETLQGYLHVLMVRDVVERYGVTNVQALRMLLLDNLTNTTGLVSINKQYQRMKSMGLKVSKDLLYRLMGYLEDAYAVMRVERFALGKNQVQPVKLYPVDSGLTTSLLTCQGFEQASLLETVVYLHLRRQNRDVYYVHDELGDVDFLILQEGRPHQLVQVCVDIQDPKTRLREIKSLRRAMNRLGVQQGFVVVWEGGGDQLEGGIWVVPVWSWLLS